MELQGSTLQVTLQSKRSLSPSRVRHQAQVLDEGMLICSLMQISTGHSKWLYPQYSTAHTTISSVFLEEKLF